MTFRLGAEDGVIIIAIVLDPKSRKVDRQESSKNNRNMKHFIVNCKCNSRFCP
jgi:hypothetical protein